ncbi:MAG: UDP-N-acetylglucosamine 2-epimerase (non-hydrolyzing) [Acidobacteria bacterium]|nr:UDP-N-acetylglucosamine 2-epimerase (non-hydrolyzing) [Acidobacteriota bacterium]
MIKVINVVGARPNFIKMAPIIAELKKKNNDFTQLLVHTGQHYDGAMSDSFFNDLKMPPPDINLEVGSGSHADQTARVMIAFEKVIIEHKPDWVVVVGDVNSTLACSLVAAKFPVKVAHVEAGLRSFDRGMPEEINRILTDQLSDLLLTPGGDAEENLLREGIDPERIVKVGNVMIDTLYQQIEQTDSPMMLERFGLTPGNFVVLTLHRPSNVDDPHILSGIISAINKISESLPVIFPAHPRTTARIREFGLEVSTGVRVIGPLGYLEFLGLWSKSRVVLTDSGGLQEETTALGIPCLTLRENTERPITIEQGTNRLVGTHPVRIILAVSDLLNSATPARQMIPEMWDGQSAKRIVNALLRYSFKSSSRAGSGSL